MPLSTQGMHELLAPLVFVLHSDHQAFLHAKEMGALSLVQHILLDEQALISIFLYRICWVKLLATKVFCVTIFLIAKSNLVKKNYRFMARRSMLCRVLYLSKVLKVQVLYCFFVLLSPLLLFCCFVVLLGDLTVVLFCCSSLSGVTETVLDPDYLEHDA